MAINFDTYDGFDGLGVTYVDGVPVVMDQDDEAEMRLLWKMNRMALMMAISMPENFRFQVWRAIHFNSLH